MLDMIQSSRFDGSDVTTLRSGHIVHPFGLAIDGDSLFFADWRFEAIAQMDKTRPSYVYSALLVSSMYSVDLLSTRHQSD